MKRRELRAIDIETGREVYVPIRVKTDAVLSEPQQFKVPCLLRNSDSELKELQVLSDEYYPLTLDLSERNSSFVFFVKKRSTSVEPNIRIPSFPKQTIGKKVFARQDTAESIKALTDDSFLLAFADFIGEKQTQGRRRAKTSFASRALLECLTNDTDEALSLYLAFDSGIRSLDKKERGKVLWNLQLIRTYYQANWSTPTLLNTQLLLPYLQRKVDATTNR